MISALIAATIFRALPAETPDNKPSHPAGAQELVRADQARSALKKLIINPTATGMWSRVEIERDRWSVSTNHVYVWLRPDGNVFRRIEGTRLSTIDPSMIEHYTIVENNEGAWNIIGGEAVFLQAPNPPAKRWIAGVPGGHVRALGMLVDVDSSDPSLVRSVGVTTERIKDGVVRRLIINERYGEKSQRRLIELAGLKRDIPLFARPFVTTSFLFQLMRPILPSRRETVIDEITGKLAVRTLFDGNDSVAFEEYAWEPCTNRTKGDFSLRPELKRLPAPTDVSVGPSTVTMIEDIALTNDDVALVKVPQGPTSLIQFTRYGTNNASYRWLSRSSDSQPFSSGKGVVVDASSPEIPHAVTRDITIEWHYQTPSNGTLHFVPKRATVKILPKDAFERAATNTPVSKPLQ
jgi:hypothetical protein